MPNNPLNYAAPKQWSSSVDDLTGSSDLIFIIHSEVTLHEIRLQTKHSRHPCLGRLLCTDKDALYLHI